MKLAIGADHAGFKLKEKLKKYLSLKGHLVEDLGAYRYDPFDDYPDYGIKVAEAVASGDYQRGILVCGSGIGMSVLANKVTGIVATVCFTEKMAKISRTHNNSNLLVLGARVTKEQRALQITEVWLKTQFEGGRHKRRLDKILEYEKNKGIKSEAFGNIRSGVGLDNKRRDQKTEQ